MVKNVICWYEIYSLKYKFDNQWDFYLNNIGSSEMLYNVQNIICLLLRLCFL
jgi:hypothetical protein